MNIEALDPASFEDAIEGLGTLLKDAVDGGASVNFLAGVTAAEATAWWAARSARSSSIGQLGARALAGR